MKVLHLISSNGLYGAERVVLELSKELKKRGIEPIVGVIKNLYNPHIEVAEEAERTGIESAIFPCSGQFDLRLIRHLRKYINENGIDLVHSHGYKSNFYALMGAGRRIAKVTTNHNWLTSHWKLKIYCLLDALWIRYFDKVIAVSSQIKSDIVKYGISRKDIEVIYNGIDMNSLSQISEDVKINLKRSWGIKDNEKVVGTIGGLKIAKGHSYLIKAAKIVADYRNDVKFMIVGDGPLKESLEKETFSLGIGNKVIFTGYRKDVPAMLSIMDIFVLPSITEGLPMILLEAMAAEKRILASPVGEIPNMINHECLVECANYEKLSHKILSLLNNLSNKAVNLGYDLELIRCRYSSKAMCEKYLIIYEGII
jgi:glycosyltransferase involved in cell wall biosynthesis